MTSTGSREGDASGLRGPLGGATRGRLLFVEPGIGGALLIGFHTRVATASAFGIMIVATYANLAVHDRDLAVSGRAVAHTETPRG